MQTKTPSIGCVVLAAGNAVRFGGDKLSAVLGGRTLLERALDAVPVEAFSAVAVVTHGGEQAAVRRLVKQYSFTLLINPQPELGISGSVRIGTQFMTDCAAPRRAAPDRAALDCTSPDRAVAGRATPDYTALCRAIPRRCDAILFQTADQPLLRRETVRNLLSLWRENPNRIAALSHCGVRGNPCVFPARFFPELLELSGDRGGSAVIRRHPADLILLEAEAAELMDADTREDLERIALLLERSR